MNITIEPMGRGHIINVTASVGLKPGWQENINDRAENITLDIAEELRAKTLDQLPNKLKRAKK